MNQESNLVGGQDSQSGGETKDVVKYETYKKAVDEVKSIKGKLSEYEAREQERQREILAEQGKFKEALESTLKKQRELEAALEAKDKAFAKKIFTKEVQEIALSLGARKEALEDIVKVGDWSTVEIDEQFQINRDQLKAQIANLSKSKPFYFANNATAPRDVNTSASGQPGKKSVTEMTKDEIIAQLKSLK